MAKDHPDWSNRPLARGRYVARLAHAPSDLRAAGRLRHLCFIEQAGLPPREGGIDRDAFDAVSRHALVEDANGRVVCTFRVQVFRTARALAQSYSAQFYDLGQLTDADGPFLELGRFCVTPDGTDADILRVAWGMLARIVDDQGCAMLFGCSSFAGTDPADHRAAFDVLSARHTTDLIRRGGGEVFDYASGAGKVLDRRAALSQVPPLLRTYLTMGGWVSDHGVIDRDLNTLHVFTGLRIADIPAARAAALRAVAQGT